MPTRPTLTNRQRSPRLIPRTIGTTVLALCGLSASALTSPAAADTYPYCGPSEYVDGIAVQEWADGHFRIELAPTDASRYDPDPGHVTEQMWYALQDCVAGLEGAVADSIWDQLECHQYNGLLPQTGPTYGLESWHGTFEPYQWLTAGCGNNLGTEPSGPLGPFTSPDAGYVDLEGAWDGVA